MGVYTSPDNLYKPTPGESGWGSLVNTNFDTIQARLLNAGIFIPDADPTGVTDSTAAITAWASAIPAGSYVKLAPARYKLTGLSTGVTWALQPGVVIEAYGVKFFQDAQTATGNNKSLITLQAQNCRIRGIEIYGYTYKTAAAVGLTVLQGTGAAGVWADAPSGGAADVSEVSRNPDFVARDVDGNYSEAWPLAGTSVTGGGPAVLAGNDVAWICSECCEEIQPPLVGPTVTDLGTGTTGPTANTDYWYAWAKLLSDEKETGLGPLTYYRAGATKHYVQIGNMPTHEGTVQSGVIGFNLYRCKLDPSVLANWSFVAGIPVAQTGYVDNLNDSALGTQNPVNTTIRLPGGKIPTSTTTYTFKHAILDEAQQVFTWVQRISPSNGDSVSLVGSATLVGRVGYGGTGSSALIATGQNGMVISAVCRDVLIQDIIIEGVNYVGINAPTFAHGCRLENSKIRACMEQALSWGTDGFRWMIRDCILGETGLSVIDNEPETTGSATNDVQVYDTIIRNWSNGSYGWHANYHNVRTRFSGVVFSHFTGGSDAIHGGAKGFLGDADIVHTGYLPLDNTSTAAYIESANVDLDLQIDGFYELIVTDTISANTPSLPSGQNLGSNDVILASAVGGTPNVYTFPIFAAQSPIFGVGDYCLLPGGHIQSTDPPYQMTITGASWAANVATVTVTAKTTTLTAGIATGSVGDTVNVLVTTNTNLFPDWSTRTPRFWFYIGAEAFKCNSKSGSGNKTWSCTRGEFGTTPAAHSIGDTVSAATSQLIGDTVVVQNVKSSNNTAGTSGVGYNIAAAITAIGPATISYAQTVNPGTFNTSTAPVTLGAQAWNGISGQVTTVSSINPGAVITATGVGARSADLLPSPVSGAAIQNVISPAMPIAAKVKASFRNVTSPQTYLQITCPNSRVDIDLDDGRQLTFVSDSSGVARQTGYIGTTVGSPVAGPFPYAAGAFATDPTNSKLWVCTVAGSPGTWKSSTAT